MESIVGEEGGRSATVAIDNSRIVPSPTTEAKEAKNSPLTRKKR